MTFYELICRLLHWEAEQAELPSNIASAVKEKMRWNQQDRRKKNSSTSRVNNE